MELTFIGLIQIVLGLGIVLAGRPSSAFLLLFLSCVFDGSAAILLPALGGSSIPPVQFALLFAFLRILVPRGGCVGHVPEAVQANKWLLLFAVYGAASAYLGPRLFGGSVLVFPMRPIITAGPFDVIPLAPTAQNITAGVYMVGAILLAIAAYSLCKSGIRASVLVSAAIWAASLHILTGVLDLVGRGTPIDEFLNLFRNGDYVQTDHEIGNFVRIRGLLPEASTYAGLGFAFFVLNAELWYRGIRPKATGIVVSTLALLLIFSTSSTAYVGLAAYALFFIARSAALPNVAVPGKLHRLLLISFMLLVVVAIMLAVIPNLPYAVWEMVLLMTVDKPASDSGLQRLFWAMQGWHGFVESYGLGIGAGSFRSSSMIMAILGSMGLIGIVTFVLYALAVFQPRTRSTWGTSDDHARATGAAFAVAAMISIVPAAIGGPQPSPPATFSLFAAVALALRPAPARERRKKRGHIGHAEHAAAPGLSVARGHQ